MQLLKSKAEAFEKLKTEHEKLWARHTKERTEMHRELTELRARESKRTAVTNSANTFEVISKEIERLTELLARLGYRVLPNLQADAEGRVITISVTPPDDTL